jgi:hypothetical protein
MAHFSAEVALQAEGSARPVASAEQVLPPVARDVPEEPQQGAGEWVAGALPPEEPVAGRAAEEPRPEGRAGEVARRREAQDAAVLSGAVPLRAALPSAALLSAGPLSTVPWVFHRDRLRRPGPAPTRTARFARAMVLLRIAWP